MIRQTMCIGLLAVGLAGCQPKPQAVAPESSQAAPASPPALSADEQGLGTPEAFVAAIYAHYADSATDADWNWTANSGANYFDAEMVALMKEDARLNDGYVGAIDAMPFCDCQDYNALHADVHREAISTDKARIVVSLQEKNASQAGRFVYDLVKVDNRWRIHDLHTPNYPSLREWLIRSNKAAVTSSVVSS